MAAAATTAPAYADETAPLLPTHNANTNTHARNTRRPADHSSSSSSSSNNNNNSSPQRQRTVTFNPLTSIKSQSGDSIPGSLRPMQSPSPSSALAPSSSTSSSSTIPSSSQHPPTTPPSSQPLLSTLNSKLRRRNSSHGSPLPTVQPSSSSTSPGPVVGVGVGVGLPRAGAHRTTKTVEKLKLLPNPEDTEAGDDLSGRDGQDGVGRGGVGDEESGRDVYSQFTRIKDPTARRDAARLGRADRERLPRVTAYCMAQGYRLDGIIRFMKGRNRTRGANPKLFDECLYSPYDYDQLKKHPTQSSSSSASSGPPPSASILAASRHEDRNEPSHSSPVKEHHQHSSHTNSPPQAPQAPTSDSSSSVPTPLIDIQPSSNSAELNHDNSNSNSNSNNNSSSNNNGNNGSNNLSLSSDLSTQVHIPEIFIFDYGTVVIWGMSPEHEQRFLNDMSKFSESPLPPESVQTEDFNFYYTKHYQARIYNDFISLRDPRNHMTKLAISHALSQSVKTSLFEDLVSETIDATSPLPALIAETGSVNLTRRQLNMQIGELFILRINIHLQGSVLDSPELMWSEPHLEPVYAAVRSYLEIDQRVGLLTERLNVIGDLLAVLREQGSRRHDEVLEWIVIILIAAEIVVAAINILVDLYAAGD